VPYAPAVRDAPARHLQTQRWTAGTSLILHKLVEMDCAAWKYTQQIDNKCDISQVSVTETIWTIFVGSRNIKTHTANSNHVYRCNLVTSSTTNIIFVSCIRTFNKESNAMLSQVTEANMIIFIRHRMIAIKRGTLLA